jgi:hypothetical protein
MFSILYTKKTAMKNSVKYILITTAAIATLLLTVAVTSVPSSAVYEAPIMVEDWMTQPFDNSYEQPLEIEEWMTKPFNI